MSFDEDRVLVVGSARDLRGLAAAVGESIGWAATDVRTRPNDTILIEEVLTRYERTDPTPPGTMGMPALYTLLWRMLSASAHGYRWSSMGRVQFVQRRIRHT